MHYSLKTSKYTLYLENKNIFLFFFMHLHSIKVQARNESISNILLLEKY